MIEVSVWAVRVGTVAVFGWGCLLRRARNAAILVDMDRRTSEAEGIYEQFERELPAEIGIETPKGAVYHYTDAAGLHGILTGGHIRATHFLHLNDRRELVEGEDLVKAVVTEMRDEAAPSVQKDLMAVFLEDFDEMAITRIVKDLYVVSFSEDSDDLSQWRAYGGSGGGYSIGFTFNVATKDVNEKATRMGLGQTMLRVRYDHVEAKERIRKQLGEAFAGIQRYVETFGVDKADPFELYRRGMVIAFQRAAAVAPALKHPTFAAEREWRLVASLGKGAARGLLCTRPSAKGIVPYLNLPLEPGRTTEGPVEIERLVVGPTQDKARGVRSAQLFLRSIGYRTEDAERLVVMSEVPFRG